MTTTETNLLKFLVCLPDSPLGLQQRTFALPRDAEISDLVILIQQTWGKAKALKNELIALLKCGDLSIDPEDSLPFRIAEWLRSRSVCDRMKDIDYLRLHFPAGPAPEAHRTIDVIVAFPSTLEYRGVMPSFYVRRATKLTDDRISLLSEMCNLPSPTECTESISAVKTSNDEKSGIHAHRPAGNRGPPTALFSPVLARFKHRLDHLDELSELEPPPKLLKACHLFIVRASEVYDEYGDEYERQLSLRSLIDGIVGEQGEHQCHGAVTWGYPIGIFLTGKNEGVDATLQSVISYVKHLSEHKHKRYFKSTNSPVVLISISGTRLEISTAVFVDGVYVDKLRSEELCLGAWHSDNVLRLGRIMVSISLFLSELSNWQKTFFSRPDLPSSISHLCPDPLPLQEGVRIPDLTYLSKLSHLGERAGILRIGKESEECAVRAHARYVALMSLESTEEYEFGRDVVVVVKFTPQYNKQAHMILAQKGLAPPLYFCEPVIGGLFMVVMDLVLGQPLWLAEIPPKHTRILEDIKSAVELLHNENLVFGDLRLQNMMTKPGGGALLVDFDWVGEDGKDRYPSTLNSDAENTWAEGVDRRAIMKKEHDLFMLEKLKRFLEYMSSETPTDSGSKAA